MIDIIQEIALRRAAEDEMLSCRSVVTHGIEPAITQWLGKQQRLEARLGSDLAYASSFYEQSIEGCETLIAQLKSDCAAALSTIEQIRAIKPLLLPKA